MKHLEVVAAILIYDGKILCMERGKGKYDYVSFKYEFPGGKIEPGEAKHAALERELREEMKLNVSVAETDLFTTVEHTYPDFSITMYAFICHLKNPELIWEHHIAMTFVELVKWWFKQGRQETPECIEHYFELLILPVMKNE